MPLAAVGIQQQDLLAGEGRGAGPHLGMGAVGEGVLHVKLELVDLPPRQPVDQVHHSGEGGHAVAADVEHHAARGEVGPVRDRQGGQVRAALPDDLAQRAHTVEDARRVRPGDGDAAWRDVEPVALGGRGGRIEAQRQPGVRVAAPGDDLPGAARALGQGALGGLRFEQQVRAGDGDQGARGQRAATFAALDLAWGGEQVLDHGEILVWNERVVACIVAGLA